MEFDNTFEIDKPVDEVFKTITDLNQVVDCVPGAKVTDSQGPDSCNAEIFVKMGSMSMTFAGPVKVKEKDPSSHKAVLTTQTKAKEGQDRADGTVTFELSGDGGSTQGKIHTTATVSGKAASMGESVVKDVLTNLTEQFTECLAKT